MIITKKGFTLIELLVVISIIGLLSSVVLASLNNARSKARNVKRISDIKQYSLAMELYYDSAGKYPYPNTTGWVCLGDYSDDKCWSGTYFENEALKTALSTYLPGLPAGDKVSSWVGYIYRCYLGSSNCTNVDIRWFLEGDGVSCGRGTEISGSYTNATYCRLIWP
ncbi:MAG: hypothetical protein A3G52_02945 [Candidatus Taylorbacteria bacterium RIFCSPLOWO2_12_FULL_43_20]|uniref:Type II secretion system protein GspG C-terminal domain-containing protein n=1 Tax=Candidatus Taylorbacteria bacterium RIFCSPLOWO2_12_FULL_43_20 TaxID=1802332 RepID=A0A1G2P315_9BACT|nr:MAG: hypothetical protein A3B98_04290 [Candidatus Taylorbacteria bacterium RIFCSPHIGHO2_02_FULL_43_55]OHA28166.1 MAG: hypothetical protein A3E92_02085 [Candidatus Taylorbacteria bacterium RIFCSPHIGHO2_12_FULL_42_34]OHA39702.1 MAG: hypothetical protein A3H58_04570 [Candidatus Taylorbacteria bacterium RIFCSPLOWO2_02_FULL_43_22b]OHA42738.1 MAG: hypothetical protein A3G52_02945 [Candidatus Taylorbacteria bacterium RIFCSPLOWO2_12_FULL_43_20]